MAEPWNTQQGAQQLVAKSIQWRVSFTHSCHETHLFDEFEDYHDEESLRAGSYQLQNGHDMQTESLLLLVQ
jgi:hypothetical protein